MPQNPRAEHRWPVAGAVLIALASYATLPSTFTPGVRYTVVAIGILLLIALVAVNPIRLHRETAWSKQVSRALGLVLLIGNQIALVQLIIQLVTDTTTTGGTLLLAALQVWITNVIVFAVVFWELDRGGPVTRERTPSDPDLPMADFRFPQDEDHDAVDEVAVRSSVKLNWTPSYIDYLYFSLSNSMAFSPTDTMPLSHRAKLLMGLESFAGFVILALVIARAVSLFG